MIYSRPMGRRTLGSAFLYKMGDDRDVVRAAKLLEAVSLPRLQEVDHTRVPHPPHFSPDPASQNMFPCEGYDPENHPETANELWAGYSSSSSSSSSENDNVGISGLETGVGAQRETGELQHVDSEDILAMTADDQWAGYGSSSTGSADGSVDGVTVRHAAEPCLTGAQDYPLAHLTCIDLANGQPPDDEMPVAILQRASAALFHPREKHRDEAEEEKEGGGASRTGPGHTIQGEASARSALNYGEEAGDDAFLGALSRFLGRQYQTPVDKSNLMATCGVSQVCGGGEIVFCQHW